MANDPIALPSGNPYRRLVTGGNCRWIGCLFLRSGWTDTGCSYSGSRGKCPQSSGCMVALSGDYKIKALNILYRNPRDIRCPTPGRSQTLTSADFRDTGNLISMCRNYRLDLTSSSLVLGHLEVVVGEVLWVRAAVNQTADDGPARDGPYSGRRAPRRSLRRSRGIRCLGIGGRSLPGR